MVSFYKQTMNLNKIFLYFTFVCFILDRYIDGIETDYNTWIVFFLFHIAINTVKKEKK